MNWFKLFLINLGEGIWEILQYLISAAVLVSIAMGFFAFLIAAPIWTLLITGLVIVVIKAGIETRNETYAEKASLDYAFVEKAWQDYIDAEPRGIELTGDLKAEKLRRYESMVQEFNHRYPHLPIDSKYLRAGCPIPMIFESEETSEP